MYMEELICGTGAELFVFGSSVEPILWWGLQGECDGRQSKATKWEG